MAKSNQFVIERIKTIQDLLSKNPSGLKALEICNSLNNSPVGTVSSTLSLMKKTGNLLYENERYILPLFPKRPEDITNNLSAYKKRYIRQWRDKRKEKQNPTIFDQAKPVEANAIQDAITLLKRNGFRVYKSVTELKEV
jgi:hypothetical protein